jgi:hypothetical protein
MIWSAPNATAKPASAPARRVTRWPAPRIWAVILLIVGLAAFAYCVWRWGF